MKTQNIKAVWIEYPAGNRAYGGGGWSRKAKHRPAPERVEIITTDIITTTGKSVIVAGQRKLKVNLFVATTGEVLRADYPLDDKLTGFGLNTRQIAAKKRKLAKLDQKIEAEEAARQAKIAEERASNDRRIAGLEGREAVAMWVSLGSPHPAPAAVMAFKAASGLSWSQLNECRFDETPANFIP